MTEKPHLVEQPVEQIIVAEGPPEPGDETISWDQDGPSDDRPIIEVDLYRLADGAVLLVPANGPSTFDAQAVESVAPSMQDEPLPLHEEETHEHAVLQQEDLEPRTPTGTNKQMRRAAVLVPLVLLLAFVAGVASDWYLLPLAASATITIIPNVKRLSTRATLLTAAHPNADQVQARPVASLSLTQQLTVPATGHGHDDATAASGVITFYNADTQAYIIPAGTRFPVGGLTVVTDATVTVQSVVPPMLGTAYAPAHITQVGSAGNIAAGSIETRCCGSPFITATNTTPFRGGQDARAYSIIQASDIHNAASSLLARLTPQATLVLHQQVQPGEQLVAPRCHPRTSSSQEAGAEGTAVSVRVTQTCDSVAYRRDSLTTVATRVLAHLAHPPYQLGAPIQVTVDSVTSLHQSTLLHVSLAGVWVYHFSREQLSHVPVMLAGKSLREAQRILTQQEGIQQVSIHLQRFDGQETLPTNPQRINVQWFSMVA